jgi:CubicO group peptidase (beta-lactamase class C family)
MKATTLKKAGFSKSRLERLNAVMRRYVEENKFAGILTMIARRGRLIHFETFGRQDIAANKSMAEDTIFRIYSMTKPITSVAAMMLYEEGQFRLNDPVSAYISAFKEVKVLVKPGFAGLELAPPQREITIHDLFIHTSGLTYGFFENSPVEAMYRDNKILRPDTSNAEMMEALAKLPLLHHPGTAWQYSVSTDVLGRLVEVISGLSLDQFFQQRIFQPLGMHETGFHVPEDQLHRFTPIYTRAETGELKVVEAPEVNHYDRPCPRLSGGGGLISTASDYMRFCQMMLNGGELEGERVLGRKTVEFMTRNHVPSALLPIKSGPDPIRGSGFGLGFRVVIDVAQTGLLGSDGMYAWGGAANTSFWIDPKEELIGILMAQYMPAFQFPVTDDFITLTYQAIID